MRAVDTVYEYRTQQISALHENAMVTKDKKETRKRTIQSVDHVIHSQSLLIFLCSLVTAFVSSVIHGSTDEAVDDGLFFVLLSFVQMNDFSLILLANLSEAAAQLT